VIPSKLIIQEDHSELSNCLNLGTIPKNIFVVIDGQIGSS